MASSMKLRSELKSQKDQLAELKDMIERVRELQENFVENSYDKPSQLRADRWYSSKLADQMKILKARIEFIQKEIDYIYKISIYTTSGGNQAHSIQIVIALFSY